MKKILALISLTALTQICQAQSNENAEYTETIQKISQIREALKLTAAQGELCSTPTSPNCTFESYCSHFANKGQNFYLYENKEGRKIGNFQMQINLKLGEACVKNPFPQALVNDPFAYPELLEDEEKAGGKENLIKYQNQVRKEAQRAENIFKDTKTRVIKLIEKRRTAGNKNEIDNMVQRIQQTEFAAPKLGDKFETLAVQGCEMPNAFYQPSLNTVTICPQLLNLPDAAIVSTLAHELGHAIDPCAMTYTYSKNDKDQVQLDMPPYLGGPPLDEIKPQIPAVFPDKNPLKEVISCLNSPASMGIKIPSQQELLKAVDQFEEDLRKETQEAQEENEGPNDLSDATVADLEDQRKAIRNNYNKYLHCGRFTNNGHTQEAFSDWIASQVIAEKLTEIKSSEKAREYAFESQGVFFSTECENVKQSTSARIQKATGPHCSMFGELMEQYKALEPQNSSTHPKTSLRVNKVVLAKPEIQKALGCKPGQNTKECK